MAGIAGRTGGNRDPDAAHAFVRRLYDELRCDPPEPLQVEQFFSPITTLQRPMIGDAD